MTLDIQTIVQGIMLLGLGGLVPYLIKQESRIKRVETKQEQSDVDGKKIDLLFDKIAEVKEIVMSVKSSMEAHMSIDKIEKSNILSKINDLKSEIEHSIYGPEGNNNKAHGN